MNQAVSIVELQKILQKSSKAAIVIHTNPDGDAIGAALGMASALKKINIECNVLIPNMYPSFLAWMPGIKDAIVFEKNASETRNKLFEADVVFCLDFNGFKRAGAMHDDLKKVIAPVVLIDHHIEPELDSFRVAISDLSASSTSELVYRTLCELGYEHLVDQDMASCLYVGIMTDTGSFSFSLKNPETFRIVADLVQKGIDAERIHRMIYDTFSEHRLRLLGHAIHNRMTIIDSCKSAIIALSLNDLNEYHYQIGDTEGLVNYPLSMEKINFAVLITERKDQIRLSFRSKGSFSVNDFARAYFDGGGHHNAAGGTSYQSMKETVSKLLKLINEHCEDLNYIY